MLKNSSRFLVIVLIYREEPDLDSTWEVPTDLGTNIWSAQVPMSLTVSDVLRKFCASSEGGLDPKLIDLTIQGEIQRLTNTLRSVPRYEQHRLVLFRALKQNSVGRGIEPQTANDSTDRQKRKRLGFPKIDSTGYSRSLDKVLSVSSGGSP